MGESVSVKGLYGRFDYELRLKEGGITLLTGPNGFGKSTLLSLLAAASAADEQALLGVPFEAFRYERDGKSATIESRGGKLSGDLAAASALVGPVRAIGGMPRGGADLRVRMDEYVRGIAGVPQLIKEKAAERSPAVRARLELLKKLVAEKLAFKTPVIGGEEGLAFVTPDGARLSYADLSVGEIRMIAFFCELLLLTPDGALVLIDEPEASMHVVWQIRLLDEIYAALEMLCGARAIVSTHSPEVIGARRELMVDLGAQYER